MAIEAPNTYTETDPGTFLAETATRVTFTNVRRNHSVLLTDDKGAGHFSGDFTHLVACQLDSGPDDYALANVWAMANVVDDYKWLIDNSEDGLFINGYAQDTGYPILRCVQIVAGTAYYGTFSTDLAYDTPYYLKVERDEGSSLFKCFIYSDSDRTTLVDTLSETLQAQTDFRYMYYFQNYHGTNTYAISGWVENLDLQEAAAAQIGSLVNGGLVNSGLVGGRLA